MIRYGLEFLSSVIGSELLFNTRSKESWPFSRSCRRRSLRSERLTLSMSDNETVGMVFSVGMGRKG